MFVSGHVDMLTFEFSMEMRVVSVALSVNRDDAFDDICFGGGNFV